VNGASESLNESVGPPRCQHRLPALRPVRTTPAAQHSRMIGGRPWARHTAIRFTTLPPSTQITSWLSRWPRTSGTLGWVNSRSTLKSMPGRSVMAVV